MDVLIDASGAHDPPGVLIQVDGHQVVVDLSQVAGGLHDPTISRVTWGLLTRNGESRPGGIITMVDGNTRTFFDQDLLKPYLRAYLDAKAKSDSDIAAAAARRATVMPSFDEVSSEALGPRII